MIALRLFLPESWTSDAARLKRAGVPVEYRTPRSRVGNRGRSAVVPATTIFNIGDLVGE
jgi:hypothetical protein